MSWWDAVSACIAFGNKQLLSPSDLVDGFEMGLMSQTRVNSTFGNTLYEKGWGSSGNPYVWSNVLHDSCHAYDVSLREGMVFASSYGGRNHSSYRYAVCK
ncbi:MAG: hypothetical protein J6V11_02535, partial [Alphaproteobacteria bacterium]|nr:hypothetical protein [Alphaproteobacteria bacterium]